MGMLVLGQYLGQHPAHSHLAGDGSGGGGVVPGEHDYLDAEMVQCGDRGGRVVLDRIGDRKHPGRFAVDGGQQGGLAVGRQLGGVAAQDGGIDARTGQQPGGPNEGGVAGHGGLHALAGDRVKAGHSREGKAAVAGARDDGGPEGVLTIGFGRGGQGEQFILRLGRLGLLHQFDDLGQHRVRTDLLGADPPFGPHRWGRSPAMATATRRWTAALEGTLLAAVRAWRQ